MRLALLLVLMIAGSLASAAPEIIGADAMLARYAGKLGPGIADEIAGAASGKELDVIIEHGNKVSSRRMPVGELLARVADDDVSRVELDQDVNALSWNIERIGAPDVWNFTTGDGVSVAIVDTGVLGGAGWNVLTNDSNVTDTHGHGTELAGVVAAVSPDADIVAVKALSGGSGQLSDLVEGVVWAVDHGAKIIVLSVEMEGYSQIMRDVLSDAYDGGVLIVAASGNDGGDVVYPAAYEDVIAVGAIDESDDLWSSSNVGVAQELVAPGFDVNTTGLSGYVLVSGTSVAAPHVAGVAALLWEYNDSLTNVEVRGLLQNTADDLGASGWDSEFGYGLVQAVLSGETSVANTSYYYEVYNISEYGTGNESFVFWVNGTGSFEDVEFGEGYYLVTKYVPDPVNVTIVVDENGLITVLVSTILWTDEWDVEGSDTDGMVWEGNDVLTFQFDDGALVDVYCADYDTSGGYDKCWGRTSTKLTDCRSAYSALDTLCGSVTCTTFGFGSEHTLPTGSFSSSGRETLTAIAYYDCDDSSGSQAEATFSEKYYGYERKRTHCTGTTTFSLQGRYDSSNWNPIENHVCTGSLQCDDGRDDVTISNELTSIDTYGDALYPCRVPLGGSCSVDDDCFTGLTCTGGTCSSPSNSTTDLVITKVIPIQVAPYSDLVVNKRTIVAVYVLNNGSVAVNTTVRMTVYPTLADEFFQILSTKEIYPYEEEKFNLTFIPTKEATNANISIEVEIAE